MKGKKDNKKKLGSAGWRGAETITNKKRKLKRKQKGGDRPRKRDGRPPFRQARDSGPGGKLPRITINNIIVDVDDGDFDVLTTKAAVTLDSAQCDAERESIGSK